eukprot:scaffold29001_cov67-Phaeocystis_antarctica.AAC.3
MTRLAVKLKGSDVADTKFKLLLYRHRTAVCWHAAHPPYLTPHVVSISYPRGVASVSLGDARGPRVRPRVGTSLGHLGLQLHLQLPLLLLLGLTGRLVQPVDHRLGLAEVDRLQGVTHLVLHLLDHAAHVGHVRLRQRGVRAGQRRPKATARAQRAGGGLRGVPMSLPHSTSTRVAASGCQTS